MNRRRVVAGLASVAALLLAGWAAWPAAEGAAGSTPALPATGAPAKLATAAPAAWPFRVSAAAAPAAERAAPDSPLLPMTAYSPAAISMAETREQGESRTPPIERAPAAELPDAWALASPDHYAQFEARQSARLYADYQQAADSELPKLRAALEAGRASGVSAEQLAMGEEKLRRLQAARDQAAALLAQQRPAK